jgi:branched-chain amino acid transport system ATP-binding protein
LARSEPLLSVRDIHTFYGYSYVVQGVSLELRAGQVVAVLGRNGMGKTTLVRSIAGLTPPRRGEVRFRGEAIAGLAPHAIAQRGIALVPQGRRIFRSLTVRENLQLPTSRLAGRAGGRRNAARRWDLSSVLEEFPQLHERIGHLGGNLSGGEQQLLAIGRALMSNPDLILMDEASEGLSPRLVQQVEGVIKQLRAHGHAALVVEQHLPLALAVADHIYVIASGRLVFDGTPADLARNEAILDAHLGASKAQLT